MAAEGKNKKKMKRGKEKRRKVLCDRNTQCIHPGRVYILYQLISPFRNFFPSVLIGGRGMAKIYPQKSAILRHFPSF